MHPYAYATSKYEILSMGYFDIYMDVYMHSGK